MEDLLTVNVPVQEPALSSMNCSRVDNPIALSATSSPSPPPLCSAASEVAWLLSTLIVPCFFRLALALSPLRDHDLLSTNATRPSHLRDDLQWRSACATRATCAEHDGARDGDGMGNKFNVDVIAAETLQPHPLASRKFQFHHRQQVSKFGELSEG